MRQYHVGALVVVDDIGGKRVPVGIVTDRDMVIEIISQSLDFNELNSPNIKIMISQFNQRSDF